MKSYVVSRCLRAGRGRTGGPIIPELEAKGAATWGNTKEEALRNIHEVAQMVIEALLEDGESLPPRITEIDQPVVAVTV